MHGILDWHSRENILGFNFTELNFCKMFWRLVVLISILKKNTWLRVISDISQEFFLPEQLQVTT